MERYDTRYGSRVYRGAFGSFRKRDLGVEMTIDDVISCMNVVKYYNPNVESLYDTFVEQKPLMSGSQTTVEAADAAGKPVWDSLIPIQVDLANAIHDYVYNVAHPFDSIMVKNTIREQMCRDLFGLEAYF